MMEPRGLRNGIEPSERIGHPGGERPGCETDRFRESGRLIEGFTEGEKIAGTGAAYHDLREEALDIENGYELLAKLRAENRFAREVRNRIETRFDFVAIERGPQEALA